MTIVNAFKEFFYKLNGVKPSGNNIAEVVANGAANVSLNNESALATRMTAAEGDIEDLEDDFSALVTDGGKSLILNSSTADSVKKFKITVVDAGTITATEIVEETAEP
jgi:NCAIR mutase (PurE)-related protein